VGSFTILTMLFQPYHSAFYRAIRARVLRRRTPTGTLRARWRSLRRSIPPRLAGLVQFVGMLLALQAVVIVISLACTLSFFAVRWAGNTTAAWVGVGVGLLALVGGTAQIVVRINRTLTAELTRRTWIDLMLLPYPRDQVVLHTIAPVFSPLLFVLGALIAAGAALVMRATPDLRTLLLWGLLALESGQLMALSVSIGMGTATLRYRLAVYVALVLGPGLIVLRAVIGWGLAGYADADTGVRRAALLVGPLIEVITLPSWWLSLLLAGGYLLVLELVVRRGFDWGVARLSRG
jgi:hypothetical protein